MHKEFSDAWNHKLLTFEHFSILQECLGSTNWTSNSVPNMQVKNLICVCGRGNGLDSGFISPLDFLSTNPELITHTELL
jgi:hypothetical protein